MATREAQVTAGTDIKKARHAIEKLVAKRFGVGHTTGEIEVLR